MPNIVKINIHEGLWSLGKSFEIKHSQGFKLPDTFNSLIGEGRYFNQQFMIAMASTGAFGQHESFEVDRSPTWMQYLLSHALTPEKFLFFGEIRSATEISALCFDCYNYWKIFLKKIVSSYPVHINFKHYIPNNLESYAGWLESSMHNAAWRKSKLIDDKYQKIRTQDMMPLIEESLKWVGEELQNICAEVNHDTGLNALSYEEFISKRNFEI